MKIAESKPTKTKPPADQAKPNVDQANFSKGKDGKRGNPKGQHQWTGQDEQWSNWQQQPYWNQSPQKSWTPTPNDINWQYPSSKGKGKQPLRTKLWCDIHQAYGHSTDWCFNNPNKSGGPPKQEWCNHHQMVIPQKRVDRVMDSHPRRSKKANSHLSTI